MPPKRHARLGASKAERWMNCLGSVAAEAKMPDSGGSEYSREGTAAHDVAERCLKSGKDAIEFLDQIIDVPEKVTVKEKGKSVEKTKIYKVQVTEEMCQAVQVFVSHVREVVSGGQLMIEQKFDLAPLNPPEEMYGTSDAVIWNAKTKLLRVIDYKNGRGLVDAHENEQLMMYGIGSVLKLSVKPKKIVLTIVQPRAHHPDGPIRSFEITYEQLVAFKRELFAAAKATQQPNAPLKVGEWCHFCKAKPTCPEQLKHAVATAQDDFSVVPYEPQLPSAEVLSDEQLDAILDRKALVIDWLKSIEQHVHHRLANGGEFPGYKLVEKRANRKWRNPDQASRELERDLGEKAYVRKPLSPAQAEKELKIMGKRLNEELYTKESSGVNLVRASDPRPAIAGSAADEFTCEVED